MTPQQYRLLKFIRNTTVHHGKAPTFKEMRNAMSVSSNQAITDWLAVLERDGYISKNKGTYRGIRVTKKAILLLNVQAQSIDESEISRASIRYSSGNTTQHIATHSHISFDTTPSNNDSHQGSVWLGGELDGTS